MKDKQHASIRISTLLFIFLIGALVLSFYRFMIYKPYFQNCTEAIASGHKNITKSDPTYRPELDKDGDGYACET